jgi:hypothetical protein
MVQAVSNPGLADIGCSCSGLVLKDDGSGTTVPRRQLKGKLSIRACSTRMAWVGCRRVQTVAMLSRSSKQ